MPKPVRTEEAKKESAEKRRKTVQAKKDAAWNAKEEAHRRELFSVEQFKKQQERAVMDYEKALGDAQANYLMWKKRAECAKHVQDVCSKLAAAGVPPCILDGIAHQIYEASPRESHAVFLSEQYKDFDTVAAALTAAGATGVYLTYKALFGRLFKPVICFDWTMH